MSQINLKDDTEIISAKTQYGSGIDFLNDWTSPLWVYSNEYGPTFIAAGQTWESTYEAIIDELTTIPESELYEAFGFDNRKDYDEEIHTLQIVLEETGNVDWPELIEGYRYQSNFTGIGIVSVGHNENLQPLTTEYLKESGIQLEIGAVE